MKGQKKTSDKMKKINDMVLKSAAKTVNSTCSWVYHQPVVPDEMKKFKRS